MRRQALHAPGAGEFLAVFRVLHKLVAREGIRQGAHIAGTLHVILPAYRVDPDVGFAEIAGQHREAGQRAYGLHPLPELGHAHAPQQRRGFGPGVQARRLADLLCADAGDGLDRLRRVALDYLTVFIKAFGAGRDKCRVIQLLGNNDVANRIQQGDVRPVA
ncbi:hypothetical protein D3C75_497800 [compost metagenome]